MARCPQLDGGHARRSSGSIMSAGIGLIASRGLVRSLTQRTAKRAQVCQVWMFRPVNRVNRVRSGLELRRWRDIGGGKPRGPAGPLGGPKELSGEQPAKLMVQPVQRSLAIRRAIGL